VIFSSSSTCQTTVGPPNNPARAKDQAPATAPVRVIAPALVIDPATDPALVIDPATDLEVRPTSMTA
jgi:hypothetical protein